MQLLLQMDEAYCDVMEWVDSLLTVLINCARLDDDFLLTSRANSNEQTDEKETVGRWQKEDVRMRRWQHKECTSIFIRTMEL